MRPKFLFLTLALIFQQIFDLCSTLYLTSLPGGVELNPILRPLWDIEGGMWWLAAIKFWLCVIVALGVPYLAKNHGYMMWAPWTAFVFYTPIVLWNGYLICSTF